jgi:hypothetical protein
MNRKKLAVRESKIAEDYAQKERMEPPKATRQEPPLVAQGNVAARPHNLRKSRISRRSPA